MHECVRNLSAANNKSLRVCWVCFPGHSDFWSLAHFHTKSAEESRGSTSSGKPVEFAPGTHHARQNLKVHRPLPDLAQWIQCRPED